MRYLVAALLCFSSAGVLAIDSAPDIDDPVLRARYETLTDELRCLVCQNQSIADSTADLATDLRRKVREMLEAGASDDEIRAFMTERYGDFVLYKPPVNATTWILWAAPVLLTLLAAGVFVFVLRRSTAAPIDKDVS